MSDEPGVIDKGWDALPGYSEQPSDGDDAVTVSISTTPGEWLVNTNDAVVVPMSMIEVVEALRSRRLTERSLVWRAGMQEWAPVEKVPQLMLAARLPSATRASTAGVATPAPPSATRASSSSQPVVALAPPRSSAPSPGVAVTRTPLPPPPIVTPRAAAVVKSRRATLPFGLPSAVSGSKPLNSRPTLPPPGPEDSEVLAVYARPAATISFDLAPEPPPRAPSPRLPETLAPLTTDSAPRRTPVPPPRSAEPSIVAARDFRQAPQFSKRLVVASSVGSALVASLLTAWLARSEAPPPTAASLPATAPLSTQTPPPVVLPPPAAVVVPEPVSKLEASPEPSAKPKPRRKVRAWKPPAKAEAPASATEEPVILEPDPPAEPNPYDAQKAEDAIKPPPPSQGSGLDLETILREESAPGS